MPDEATPPAPTDAPAGAPPAAGAAAPVVVRATTCAQCSKRLDRKKLYYRNGKYFCNKRCWRSSAAGIPATPAAG